MVVERDGPELAGLPCLDASEQTVIVEQGPAECLHVLALRVARRVLVLQRSQRCIGQVLLALGLRFDTDSTTARVRIAQVLMAHSLSTAVSTELVLCSTPAAGAWGVYALVDELRGASTPPLPIQVHFQPS